MPESKKEKAPGGGIRKMYEAVNRTFDLPAGAGFEVFFDKPMREAEGIMSAVSKLRCGGGFSHGTRGAGFTIKEHQAKLCPNAAKAPGECLPDLKKASPWRIVRHSFFFSRGIVVVPVRLPGHVTPGPVPVSMTDVKPTDIFC